MEVLICTPRPRWRLRVMVFTRLEGIALHTGDPGKWNMQINKTEKTTTALYSTRRGGYVAALC